MKVMNFKHIVFGTAAACMLASCDFLEPKSTSEFVPRDANSLNELLLGNAYPRKDVSRMNLYLNMMDDDVTSAPYQAPSVGLDVNLYTASYTWQPDMCRLMMQAGYSNPDIYFPHYQLIMGCNAVLDYIGQATDTKEKIDNVLAQSYALRGFLYFKLVNIFGEPYQKGREGLGVPLKLTSAVVTTPLYRNTVGECYDQILADLHKAEELYEGISPDVAYWKSDARTSLPMVQLMLSRTYLYMENWAKAAEYAKKVMDNRQFRLLDLKGMSLTNSMGYPTTVDMHSFSNPECIWLYGNVSDMIDWVYTPTRGTRNHPFFAAAPDLMESFGEGDLRKTLYVARSNWMNNGEYMPCAYGKLPMQEGTKFYQPEIGEFTFARSLRLSEVYLNYIEAETMLYKEGNSSARTEAIAALNELRRNRIAAESYQPVDFSNADDLLDFVKEERRRELCYEDHRWYDLRRWGRPEIRHIWYTGDDTAMEYVLNADDPIYTCPLPEQAIEANHYLVQIPLGASRTGTPITLSNN